MLRSTLVASPNGGPALRLGEECAPASVVVMRGGRVYGFRVLGFRGQDADKGPQMLGVDERVRLVRAVHCRVHCWSAAAAAARSSQLHTLYRARSNTWNVPHLTISCGVCTPNLICWLQVHGHVRVWAGVAGACMLGALLLTVALHGGMRWLTSCRGVVRL